MNFTTVIERTKLLEILEENKKNHIKSYDAALKGCLEKVEQDLIQKLKDVQNGKKKDLFVSFIPPVSYEREYNRAIRAMTLHTESSVELSMENFNNLVMDEWGWSSTWYTSNSIYYSGISITGAMRGYL